ncbi:MAG: FG-GAP-like repeat-containing protein, partial [Saprospiraceae bacterium]|nr:FG-GAP-like repeat-containing protein [Saprospiraceae bacterium]
MNKAFKSLTFLGGKHLVNIQYNVLIYLFSFLILPFVAFEQSFTSVSNGAGLLNPSISAADFNNDSYTDILLTGNINSSTGATYLYQNNGSSSFTEVSSLHFSNLPTITNGAIAWADYNRDGYIDFAIAGKSANGTKITQLYRNGGSANNWVFSQDVASITGIDNASISWADVNRDGYPDLFIEGKNANETPISQLFLNNGESGKFSFTASSCNFVGLANGSSDWADYNRDGLIDLVLTGNDQTTGSSNYYGQTLIYTNLGNSNFSLLSGFNPNAYRQGNAGLNGNAEWGDYNNDGYADLLTVGSEYGSAVIYKNNQDGSFTAIANLLNIEQGKAHWGDINNDGYLDIGITGFYNAGNGLYSMCFNLYTNNKNDGFSLLQNSGTGFMMYSDFVWFDFNADTQLDAFISGSSNGTSGSLQFYKNNGNVTPVPNNKSPMNLQNFVLGNNLLILWEPPASDSIASYNIYLSNENDVLSVCPDAITTTGKRKIIAEGNQYTERNYFAENLPSGNYYWGVQAVYPNTQGSRFSYQGPINIPNYQKKAAIQITSGNNVFCASDGPTLKAVSYPIATNWQWYLNNTPISGAIQQNYTVTSPGLYYAICGGYDAPSGGTFSIKTNVANLSQYPVPQPPTVLNNTVNACYGQTVHITVSPGLNGSTCLWYNNGQLANTGNTLTITPTNNISYQVYTYDPATACQSPDYTTINVIATPYINTPIVSNTTICDSTSTTITATTSNGTICHWYTNNSDTTPLFTGNSYVTPILTASTQYFVSSYQPSSGCESPKIATLVSVISRPKAPTTQNTYICQSESVLLSATPQESNATCNWYLSRTSTTSIHQGTTYLTSNISQDTMFFVSSVMINSNCESESRSPIFVAYRPELGQPLANDQTGYISQSGQKTRIQLWARPTQYGTTCKWYSDSGLKNLVATGTSYLTPSISSTQTYYVTNLDATTGCEGSQATAIKAQVAIMPARILHPDYVYPVASIPGDHSEMGLNLVTGDAIPSFEIGQITAGAIQFSLKVQYNSRAAAITPYYVNNNLGGLGWKMLDYPKMVYDDELKNFYFLDGKNVYKLDTVSNQSNQLTLRTNGDAFFNKFVLNTSSINMPYNTWTVSTEKGTQYYFNQLATSSLSNGQGGNIWNITKIGDTQHLDSLVFDYSNNQLINITSSTGGYLELSYQNSLLSNITYYQKATNNNKIAISKTNLVYNSNVFTPLPTAQILISLQSFENAAIDNNSTQWVSKAPATVFTYNTSNYNGALSEITNENGGIINFTYGQRLYDGVAYFPVTETHVFSGTTYVSADKETIPNCKTTTYTYLSEKTNTPYCLYNYVSAYPGTSESYTHLQTLSTSFETSSSDLVFANLKKINISSAQALTGKNSYFFNGNVNNTILQSQTFSLTKPKTILASDSSFAKAKTSMGFLPDSLTVSYFINQTHQTLDVTHIFSYRFYDSKKHMISFSTKEVETTNEFYGQWVQVIQRLAIPDKAVQFDFTIEGGSAIYYFDFYLDVVTVSGAAYAPQGRTDYYFYTGAVSDSLRHLPEAYREMYQNDSIRKIWYSGFEQNTFTNDWLILGNTNDACYPKVTLNTNDFEISYAGSGALEMQACSNGHYSQIRMPDLPVPSGTMRAKIAFRYSKAQVKGLQFKVHVEWNGGHKDSTLILDGSYLIDPDYKLYFDEINIPNNLSSISYSIAVINAGTNTKVNSFYIDNLQIACYSNKDNNITPITSTNATDETLIGKMYCNRILKNNFSEVSYSEKLYLPTLTSWRSKAPQLYAILSVERGTAVNYTVIKYNNNGLPISAISSHELSDVNDKPFIQLTNNQLTYAADIYPALNRDALSLYATPIATTTLVKNLIDHDWEVNSCHLAQWKNFSSNATNPLWMPWRSFILQTDTSIHAVSEVLQNTQNNNYYTPPNPLWLVDNQVFQRDNKGLAVYSMGADSIYNFIQYSKSTYTQQNSSYTTQVLPVAVFANASPQNAFYYGFEAYEQSNAQITSTNNSTYTCMGGNAAKGNTTIGFAFNKNQTLGSDYVFSLWAMPQTSSIQCSITGSVVANYAVKTFTIPDSLLGKWIYLEILFSISGTSDSLVFTLTANNNTYFDDIRFSPIEGDFSAIVYKKSTNSIIGKFNNNGQIQKYLYNAIGDQICQINTNDVPTSIIGNRYYSRSGANNKGIFNPNDPNSQVSISTNSKGSFYGFNSQSQQNAWQLSSSGSYFSNGQLAIGSNSSAYLKTSYLPTDASHYAMAFQWTTNSFNTTNTTRLLKLQLNTYYLTLSFTGGTNAKITAVWGSNGAAINFPLNCTSIEANPVELMMVFNGSSVWLWINGNYALLTQTYTASNGIGLNFSNVASAGIINYIDNLCLLQNPVISASYYDGLENNIQTQVTEGTNIIVSATLYDDMQRPAINTKKVRLSNVSTLAYNTSFISDFNWYTGVMQGLVDNAYTYDEIGNQDNGYFYYRNVYEGSPQTALSAQFQAGKDFALRTYSTWEKGKRWAYENVLTYVGEAITIIGYTIDAVTIIVDPAAAPEIIIMDAANIIAGFLAGSNDNSDTEYPFTKYLYNNDLQLSKIKLPKSNLKNNPDKSQIITLGYDARGNTSQIISPESGILHTAYDYYGRRRISQNDLQKANNQAQYYKFDKMGRPIEEGIFPLSNWDLNTLELNCVNSNYPESAQGAQANRKIYYSGINGINSIYGSASNRGRITSLLSYNNGQQIQRKELQYDNAGQIILETQLVDNAMNTTDTFQIKYAYNLQGQTTRIDYPAVNNQVFWVQYQYNALGQCTGIISSSDNNLANYSYNPDGSLHKNERLLTNGGKFPEYRLYNAPGWLTTIAAGDTVSNKPRFFSYTIGYNLLEDWWSSLWGQSYYNGNVASTNYSPGPNTNLQTLKDGYTYNPYNALESYYSNYVNAEIFDGVNSYVSETMEYDVNGNIKNRGYQQERGTGDLAPKGARQSKFKYNSKNQPKEMDFYLQAIDWHWYGSGNTYNYDTSFMKYDAIGNLKTITYNRHNTTKDVSKKGSLAEQTIRSFSYNNFGLLQSGSFTSTNQYGSNCSYTYDAQGLRLTKNTTIQRNQQTLSNYCKTYVNAFNKHILAEKVQHQDGHGIDTMRYYVWGPEESIEAMYITTNGNQFSSWWVLKDHLGSARQLIDRSNNTIVSAWAYNEYGEQLPDLQRNTAFFPYLFTGQEFDPELNVYNYKARIYEPKLTQFLSPDPAMQNPATPYAYVTNNPTNYTDPTGMIRIRGFINAGAEVERDIAPIGREINTNARFVTNMPLNQIPPEIRPFAGHISDWAEGTGFTGVIDYGANGNPDYYILKPTAAPGDKVFYADNITQMDQRLVPARQGGHIQAAEELDQIMKIERKNHLPNDKPNMVSQWSNIAADYYGTPRERDRRGGFAVIATNDANIKAVKWKSHNINPANFDDDIIPHN